MRPDVLSCAAGCRLSTASRRYVRCSRLSPTGALCPPPPAPLQLHRPAAAGSETGTIKNTRGIDSYGIPQFSSLSTCRRLTTLRMKHFRPTCLVGAVLSVRWSLRGAPPGRLPGSQTAAGDLAAGKLVEQAARQSRQLPGRLQARGTCCSLARTYFQQLALAMVEKDGRRWYFRLNFLPMTVTCCI